MRMTGRQCTWKPHVRYVVSSNHTFAIQYSEF